MKDGANGGSLAALTSVDTATQGAWLDAMGIGLRAQALSQRSPERAPEIAAAHDRLTGTDGMGELFKVMAITPRGGVRGAGFG